MIEELQSALVRESLDGWLFFDYRRRDPLAYRILHLVEGVQPSRRWYYFIPATGSPRKLVHRIEAQIIDTLPGEKHVYSSWSEQEQMLRLLLKGARKIAMQYSPKCAIPYVSNVDAGTLEFVRGVGLEVVSSADLVQEFEASWSAAQLKAHLEAGKKVDEVRREAFLFVAQRLQQGQPVSEYDTQQFILQRFEDAELSTDHGPIVAVNQNASDPHYEPTRERYTLIQREDVLLIDLWAKLKTRDAVYYDITWTGFCGRVVPDEVQNIFQIVKGARKAASGLVRERVGNQEPLYGWEVDDAARHAIASHGLAESFFHRTGHSIGTEVHGTGANMDNFESHDDRKVIPNTCFSIEPGIYLPRFGIRSEVNLFVSASEAWVTGEEQESLVLA